MPMAVILRQRMSILFWQPMPNQGLSQLVRAEKLPHWQMLRDAVYSLYPNKLLLTVLWPARRREVGPAMHWRLGRLFMP